MGKSMAHAACILLLMNTLVRAETTSPRADDMKIKAELRPLIEAPRIWMTTEYVHYWQNTTTKLPQLLSNADPTDTFPVGSYYGNKGITWNDGNGFKLTVGAWIDDRKRYGVELTGFYIPRQTQSNNYSLSSGVDAFFSDFKAGAPPGINRIFFPTDPASQAGFHYSTEQYGGEANTLVHMGDWEPTDGLKITVAALGGFRYFGLQDSYSDQYVEPTAGYSYNDDFKTDNNFYGANFGAHVRMEYERFFAEITPKIALGVTDESVGVNGSNVVALNPGSGGFYASGNKLGHRSSAPFAYLPQITIKLGYGITKNIEAFIGYDALYLSDVARVENQISTQLDGNQMAGFNFGSGPDQSPAPTVQSSSLFEQGVTAGLTLKL
jgi:hypothetical protein